MAKLNDLAAAGHPHIVDPTVLGLGRYLPWVQRVAEQVDLQSSPRPASTPTTTSRSTSTTGASLRHRPGPDGRLFVRDITEGIADTGVKAGIIKCATDVDGLTPGVERVLRACARTHREPACRHDPHRRRARSGAGTSSGSSRRRASTSAGWSSATPATPRPGLPGELMDKGSTIGMDRFGIDVYLPIDDRVQVVADLCAQGYADRMVLAHDAACYMDWFTPEVQAAMAPNWHFNHISDDVLPLLLERGVTQDQIDQMLTGNPRRLFEMTGAY